MGNIDAPDQCGESRIVTDGIKPRVNFEINQLIRVFAEGLIECFEGQVSLAQTNIDQREFVLTARRIRSMALATLTRATRL